MEYQAGAKRPNFTLPKGEYSAKIIEVEEKTSKVKADGTGGNPMLLVKLEVYNGEKTKFINDYIVTGGEFAQDWKIAHLVAACGLPVTGSISPNDIVERNVRVKLKIKPAKGDYPEDNAIDDYLKTEVEALPTGAPKASVGTPAAVNPNDPPF